MIRYLLEITSYEKYFFYFFKIDLITRLSYYMYMFCNHHFSCAEFFYLVKKGGDVSLNRAHVN